MGRLRIVLLIWIAWSCSASSEQILKQAVEVHTLSMNISEHVVEKIDRIGHFIDTAIVDQELKDGLRDSLLILRRDLQEWQSGVIGVPGYEPENHDHHHHGASPENLSPEMVLEIQQILRDGIIQLNIRSQQMLDQLEKVNENKFSNEKPEIS